MAAADEGTSVGGLLFRSCMPPKAGIGGLARRWWAAGGGLLLRSRGGEVGDEDLLDCSI